MYRKPDWINERISLTNMLIKNRETDDFCGDKNFDTIKVKLAEEEKELMDRFTECRYGN